MYRIAWCIKTFPLFEKNQYSYGEWHEKKKYNELKDWCYTQNALDFNTYYWIEKKENDKIKNVIFKEEYETEFVNIEKR
jgi:hypothetical protein|tara:strand:+ start:783 stop:1019 length:237 start_codon:yes stop_codon:yes gene_type:complete